MELVWRLSVLALRVLYDSKYGSLRDGVRLCVVPSHQKALAALGPTHYRLARTLNAIERRCFLKAAGEGAERQQEWANLADEIVREYRKWLLTHAYSASSCLLLARNPRDLCKLQAVLKREQEKLLTNTNSNMRHDDASTLTDETLVEIDRQARLDRLRDLWE
eukprot:8969946-Pyramimonas_sp.AAC.2